MEAKSDEVVGIRLDALRRFCTEHCVADRQLTTGQVCKDIIKSETESRECSYASLHPEMFGSGPAIVFVSHPWSGRLMDVVACAESFAVKHGILPSELYLLIDIFTVNQHLKVPEADSFEVFSSLFKATLVEFKKRNGKVLIVLSPLDDPEWLHYSWCLFELLMIHLLGLKHEFMVPPESKKAFIRQLCTGDIRILDVLSRIDTEKAVATIPNDDTSIKSLVRETAGFLKLNSLACDAVRDFCVSFGKEALEGDMPVEGSESADELRMKLLGNLGGIHDDLGHYDSALSFYGESVDICKRMHGPKHQSVGDTQNKIAIVHQKLGQYEKALEMFQEALEIKIASVGPSHHSVADTKGNMANVLKSQGRRTEAEALYQECAIIYQAAYGAEHEKTLGALAQARSC